MNVRVLSGAALVSLTLAASPAIGQTVDVDDMTTESASDTEEAEDPAMGQRADFARLDDLNADDLNTFASNLQAINTQQRALPR